jgi:signal transduction histidine kinase
MDDSIDIQPALRPEELEAVYAISRAIAMAQNMDSVLDEIIKLARPVFIFDNMVLYLLKDQSTLEPAYVRAIGRGRYNEAELTWGETIAFEVLQSNQIVERLDEAPGAQTNRMRLRYMLGLPLVLESQPTGALVFIRFGGPVYEPDQIRLAEFISGHVAQLIGHNRLVQQIANLEAERRLERLQEDFIATVSHDLLTPLGFIKGYATTLLREGTNWDDVTRTEFLTIIDEEADKLRELIDNLMDSSRLQAGTLRMSFQRMRFDAFLKDIVLGANTRHDNLKVQLDSDVPELKIFADPPRLAQVFDNLLTNASKYAPGCTVKIGFVVESDTVHVKISDNGPGIAKEYQSHLFKRFYRVPTKDTNVRGTGLGLFICRQIIRAHEGEIWVDSKPGDGTTFNICLPLNQDIANKDILLRENKQ